MADPRKNLPSASGLERLKKCRGSRLLEKELTNYEESEIANAGTLIHNCLAGIANPDMLDEQGRFAYEVCIESEDVIKNQTYNYSQEVISRLKISGEERLWLYDENGVPILSGAFDKLYIDPVTNSALVVDYKTGYKAQTDPAKNIQLRAYAVLVWQTYGIETVTVALIQPNCKPLYAKCQYTLPDLKLALKEIRHILLTAQNPLAIRTPGEKQCEYCRAKGVCKELADFAKNTLENFNRVTNIILVSSEEMDKREEMLDGQSLAECLDMGAFIKKWNDALKAEGELRLKAMREVPGYAMLPGKDRREITDNYEFYETFKQWGMAIENKISPKEILETASFSLGAIESIINRPIVDPSSELYGKKPFKAKELKKILDDIFPDLIGVKAGKNSIGKVDEPLIKIEL